MALHTRYTKPSTTTDCPTTVHTAGRRWEGLFPVSCFPLLWLLPCRLLRVPNFSSSLLWAAAYPNTQTVRERHRSPAWARKRHRYKRRYSSRQACSYTCDTHVPTSCAGRTRGLGQAKPGRCGLSHARVSARGLRKVLRNGHLRRPLVPPQRRGKVGLGRCFEGHALALGAVLYPTRSRRILRLAVPVPCVLYRRVSCGAPGRGPLHRGIQKGGCFPRP